MGVRACVRERKGKSECYCGVTTTETGTESVIGRDAAL